MANANDVYVPEVWAGETLSILKNRFVLGNLVHRDYSNDIATKGDTVNVQKPNTFTATDGSTTADGTYADATSANIPVIMNKHKEVRFLIHDKDRTLGMAGLVEKYLDPAAYAIAEAIETDLAAMFKSFTGNVGTYNSTLTEATILAGREKMLDNKAPMDGSWNLVIRQNAETQVLQIARLTEADKTGTSGEAIKEAMLGRRFGITFYTSQFAPKSGTSTSNCLFHPKALALVTRNMVSPPEGFGARSFTVNEGNFAIRVTMAYDIRRSGMATVVDTLYGVAKLYDELGVEVKS